MKIDIIDVSVGGTVRWQIAVGGFSYGTQVYTAPVPHTCIVSLVLSSERSFTREVRGE